VAFNNFNNAVTGSENRSQVLLARSTDGGQSFSAPARVGYFYELPDLAPPTRTARDAGRACVPEKGPSANSVFRASNYPIGAVDPTHGNGSWVHLRVLHQPELQRGQRLHPGRPLGHHPEATSTPV